MDPIQDIWSEVKRTALEADTAGTARVWLDPLTPLRIENGSLVLACPNDYFLGWVRDHYLDGLNQTLAGIGHTEARRIALVVQAPAPASTALRVTARQYDLPEIEVHAKSPLRFNPRFTFDRFVVGQANRFAYSATLALADGQGLETSCLFLVADTGLGKSHLAQALGHQILSEAPRQKVRCLTAEDFTNELVHAIRTSTVEDFKDRYRRACDVLILEEIHFLAGKEKVQAELCYTLDILADHGARVVFTAPCPLRDIPRLGRAMASRLAGGLVSTIEPPDYATRLKILDQKAREHGLAVADQVLEVLASRVTQDVRRMESCLYALGARSRLLDRPIDLSLAEEALADLADKPNPCNLEQVQETVCRYYRVSLKDLQSRSRDRRTNLPRNVGIYLGRKLTGLSFEEIGRAFGRNHSTALYTVHQVETKLRRDPALKGQVEFLAGQLNAAAR